MYIAANPQNVDIFQPGRIVGRDDDNQHFGIIESVQINTDVENGDYLTVKGRFLMCLLERRIIHPTYNVTAEKAYSEIVREVVTQNTLLNDSRKKQGYRTDIMSSSGTSTKTELAEEFGISVKKLYMLISFTQLINYFANKVDDNTLPDKVAYCLAFLSEYEQHIVEEYLTSNPNYVLTADKAERLKDKKDKDKNLDKRTIDAILSAVRQRKTIETTTVKLNTSTFEKYGLKGKTANEISDILEKALQNYFENEQEIE